MQRKHILKLISLLPDLPAHRLPVCVLHSRLAQLAGLPVLRGGDAVVPRSLPHLLPHAPVQAADEDALHQLAADGKRSDASIRLCRSRFCISAKLLHRRLERLILSVA